MRFFKENKIQLFKRVFQLIQNRYFENDEIYDLVNKISETSKKIYIIENKIHTLKKELKNLKTEIRKFKVSIKEMKTRKTRRYVHIVFNEKELDDKISRSGYYAILVNDLYNFYLFLPLIKNKFTI
jgi:septal ring factor EnvC (AmiA/AmiB activator)